MLWILLACHPALDADPAGCAECHTETALWQGSRHASAFDNALFAEAFRRADDPWCLTCHEPDGVGCDDCHLGEPADCARCHQFALPGTSVPSQDTVAEHARSSQADTPCHTCHDPHAAPGGHDEARVRAAVSVDVVPVPDGVQVRLSSHGVGHAFPTGDPFRRFVFEVCSDLRCNEVVGRHTFERRLVERTTGWEVVADNRIPPPTGDGDPSVTARIGLDRAARSWKLSYHYADPRHGALRGEASMVVDVGPLQPLPSPSEVE